MFTKLKRVLFIIPCLIFGLFLFGGINVGATEAILDTTSVVEIGEGGRENTYYFSDKTIWEFEVQNVSLYKDKDRFLKWRVVLADGSATEWSSKDYYVDNKNTFVINTANLKFNEKVDMGKRELGVAPLSTYYVDIQYYTDFLHLFSKHLEEKDETIKIIAPMDNGYYLPEVVITYKESSNNYDVLALMQDEFGAGYGIITKLEYFFYDREIDDINPVLFGAYMDEAPKSWVLHLDSTASSKVDVLIDGEADSLPYLYIKAESLGGRSVIVKHVRNVSSEDSVPGGSVPGGTTPDDSNNSSGTTTPDTDNSAQKDKNPDKGTGLFDLEIGEVILIILVIVLVVSCVLIIAQKIVDYKKRLY